MTLPAARHGPLALFAVPTAVWVYGLLRSLAFVAPTWAGGSIGLGTVVVMVLFVLVVRRSRRAWLALVFLDVLSLPMLLAAWMDADAAPIAVPLLTGMALGALLAPSTRRFVGVGATAAPADRLRP